MKIAAIYTSTTPELLESVNTELRKQLDGIEAEIVSYQNPEILAKARENGGVTPWCARRLMDLYEQACDEGADILLNLCSSVGDAARLCKPLYEMTGVKFVRVDEDMAREAVRKYSRIGVVATLPTTMAPTGRLVLQCAEDTGKTVTVVEALADGAFGLDRQQFVEKLIVTGGAVRDRVDALVFAQGSMAYAQDAVSAALGLPVLSSVGFGAAAVRRAALELQGERV